MYTEAGGERQWHSHSTQERNTHSQQNTRQNKTTKHTSACTQRLVARGRGTGAAHIHTKHTHNKTHTCMTGVRGRQAAVLCCVLYARDTKTKKQKSTQRKTHSLKTHNNKIHICMRVYRGSWAGGLPWTYGHRSIGVGGQEAVDWQHNTCWQQNITQNTIHTQNKTPNKAHTCVNAVVRWREIAALA